MREKFDAMNHLSISVLFMAVCSALFATSTEKALLESLAIHEVEAASTIENERKVVLRITIGLDGGVEEAEVIRSSSDALSQRALKMAQEAQFTPTLIDGKPSKVTGDWPIVFPFPEAKKESEIKAEVAP